MVSEGYQVQQQGSIKQYPNDIRDDINVHEAIMNMNFKNIYTHSKTI